MQRLLRACGYALAVEPLLGQGVDRSIIRERLALSPAERLSRLTQEARVLQTLRSARRKPAADAQHVEERMGREEESRSDNAQASGPFDPLRILRALAAHRVAFLVIGGVAAGLHGSPTLTADLDIC